MRWRSLSIRQGVQDAIYFLRYFDGDGVRIASVIVLSLVATLCRLPLMYLPTLLTEHFAETVAVGPTHSMSEGFVFGLGREVSHRLWDLFGSPLYLQVFVGAAVFGIILLAPIQLLRAYGASVIGGNLLLRLRTQLYGRLPTLSMLAIYERGASSFVQQLNRDMFILHDFLLKTLSGTLPLLLQIVIYTTTLLMMNLQLTLAILVSFLLLQPLLIFCNRRIQLQALTLQEQHEGVTNFMLESIGGYRDVMAAGRFQKMHTQFAEKSADLRFQSIQSVLWSEYGELALNLVFGILTMVPYLLLVQDLKDVAQVGRTITYVVLVSSLLPSLAGLWGMLVDLSSAAPSLGVLRETLATGEGESKLFPEEPSLTKVKVESIRFEQVGVELKGRWILQDLNFTLEGGKLSALIGQSGAGKTTIFHLLLRLIEPTSGQIYLNEKPLSQWSESELRRLIGFIPQNPFIFNTSLRENLVLADPHQQVSTESLAEAIGAAQLQDMIEHRREEGGLDAGAGYLGMRLSGGERQRIALARVLLQDPELIVCDEYTANIDVKTAHLIQQMMSERFKDRTRVVITHELYSAKGADQILVLDQGRIVQVGTHEALLSQGGLYRELWETQRI